MLTAALRPARTAVTLVKISDGRVEEVHEAEIEERAKVEVAGKEVVGATVCAPVRGCPSPAFEQAEVRATRVLRAFASPRQMDDFKRRQAFLAVGVDTGHRYQLTSRLAGPLYALQGRCLYDLDERRAVCVHDWDVPAAEELLAILLFLSTPGRELYLRALPDGPHDPLAAAFVRATHGLPA